MTDVSEAADTAQVLLDETTSAIEAERVPGLQQSLDRARDLSGATKALSEEEIRANMAGLPTLFDAP